MATTVEVRFKGNRKDYFLWDGPESLHLHQPVVVEVERGLDFGRVGATGESAAKKCAAGCSGCASGTATPAPTRPVLRVATQDEIRNANDLRRSEDTTRIRATERVRHYGLEMKVSDAEWQWDRKKLTFYFTAEKRVDFRDLVRDLASTFKTRIELRQIGVRDEAARLGGVGRCGKEYCCSTWLKSLDPVSLALAKDQHLSLNPAQISGGCGRLLCCLKYEHEFYVTSRKRFPKEGKTVRTKHGAEKVIAVDIFRERVFLRGDEHGHRTVLLADLREEMAGVDQTAPTIDPALPPRAERQARPSGAQQPMGQPTRPPERQPVRPKPEPEPQVAPPTPAEPLSASAADPERAGGRSKRRRRRRGRGGSGPSNPSTPDV
ncbi:MAG: PSP1 domain-containing protein [Gemmatimonadales bacterium]